MKPKRKPPKHVDGFDQFGGWVRAAVPREARWGGSDGGGSAGVAAGARPPGQLVCLGAARRGEFLWPSIAARYVGVVPCARPASARGGAHAFLESDLATCQKQPGQGGAPSREPARFCPRRGAAEPCGAGAGVYSAGYRRGKSHLPASNPPNDEAECRGRQGHRAGARTSRHSARLRSAATMRGVRPQRSICTRRWRARQRSGAGRLRVRAFSARN